MNENIFPFIMCIYFYTSLILNIREGGFYSMRKLYRTTIILLIVMLLSACSQGESSHEGNYDTTRKMVVDILQTDDAKKALIDMMSSEEMKQQLVLSSDVVQEAINHVLTSEKGTEMWVRLFNDPDFIKTFSESMSEQQQELIKKLMNDSDYQKSLIEILQNPEISTLILSVLKGQQFRVHLEETIQETLDTPLFQVKITDILLKAAEKQGSSDSGGQEQSGDEQQSDGGGGGSGNGNDSGGEGDSGGGGGGSSS